MTKLALVSLTGLISFALLVRWLVGQFPYSGQGKPPMYGDYEAQRHWMEITTNLPVQQWYLNTTNNDLQYWGLDYPPLTAYHMYLLGQISNKFLNASWLELHTSRGHESHQHKIFMRSTVVISDFLFYIPAIIYYFYNTQPTHYSNTPSTVHRRNLATYTALVLFYPAQILIDHGHFQYNCVFMGLVLWAVVFMTKERHRWSALFFTLALMYKQMSLYYSLPFFWYILSVNLRIRPIKRGLINVFLVGLLVSSTFAVMFLPYIRNYAIISQVINRIFPIDRGLFEDKVANIWFSLSIFYKFRKLYTIQQLLKFSAITTIISCLPAGIHLLFRPSTRAFRYALVNTSMAFFLLSFQVHEKTILVPALPILLLIREHPMIVNWFMIISTFSLQPLCIKDGQLIPYLILMIITTLFMLDFFRKNLNLSLEQKFSMRNIFIVTYLTSILGSYVLTCAALLVKPPSRYPDIHPSVNALYSCAHFCGFLGYFYYRQFVPETRRGPVADRATLIKKAK